MRQAIETKYLGATDTRGARIKASAQAGTIYVSYDYALTADQAHQQAAAKLAEKFGWAGKFVSGGNAKGDGYVHVLVD